MRRTTVDLVLVALAGAVLGLVPIGAHASDSLASCASFVPGAHVQNPSIGGPSPVPVVSTSVSCRAEFSLAATTNVTLTLTPGPDFAGGLTGTLRGPASHNLKSVFVANVAVSGAASQSFSLSPGDWELELKAGDPAPAAGDFSGSATI